jgi:hypothetical protein
MKKLLFLLLIAVGMYGQGIVVVPASASSTVIATSTTLVCTMQATSSKTAVTIACNKSGTVVGTTTLNLNAISLISVWSLAVNPTTDIISGTFTQGATLGTITYSVTVNGGAATTGTF